MDHHVVSNIPCTHTHTCCGCNVKPDTHRPTLLNRPNETPRLSRVPRSMCLDINVNSCTSKTALKQERDKSAMRASQTQRLSWKHQHWSVTVFINIRCCRDILCPVLLEFCLTCNKWQCHWSVWNKTPKNIPQQQQPTDNREIRYNSISTRGTRERSSMGAVSSDQSYLRRGWRAIKIHHSADQPKQADSLPDRRQH